MVLKISVRQIVERIENLWPWHHQATEGGDDKGGVSNLNPVLLVPGIGGSILNAVDKKGNKERVWVRLFEADHEFRAKLFSYYDPVTGKTMSLDKNITIEVPEDRYGLYSCDILDPDVILRLDTVYYFHDLIAQMKGWGYREGKTLFGFGYDFRQSNRLGETMDRMKVKLETMYEAAGGKKVDIITHSMGGLVVKSFLALHPEVFEKYVNSWIAVTAPFQGAPGFIMDCLLTGVEFVKGWQRELFVAKWSMHQLLIECPSVYELIASPHFDWSEPPELRLWRKLGEEESEKEKMEAKLEAFGPKENLHVMMAALENNQLNYNGVNIPLPLNKDIVKWANETLRIMHTAKLPEGVKFYNLYGTSCETPFHACYGSSKSPLDELTEILNLEAEFSCVDGDGTVPVESAMADGLNAEARIGIPGDHRGILMDEHFFHIVKHWLKVGGADPEYDPESDYVIVPRRPFELDSHREERVDVAGSDDESMKMPPKEVYIATVETGSGSSSDIRAEAHAQVHHKRDHFREAGFQVSTIGVAEGLDKEETQAALDQAMTAACEEAKAANLKNKRITSDKTCYLRH